MIHRSCISSQKDKGGDNTIIYDAQQTGYPVEAAAALNPTSVKAGQVEHTGRDPVRNVMFCTVSRLWIKTGYVRHDDLPTLQFVLQSKRNALSRLKLLIKLGLVAEAGEWSQTQGQPGLHSMFQVSQNYSVKK